MRAGRGDDGFELRGEFIQWLLEDSGVFGDIGQAVFKYTDRGARRRTPYWQQKEVDSNMWYNKGYGSSLASSGGNVECRKSLMNLGIGHSYAVVLQVEKGRLKAHQMF